MVFEIDIVSNSWLWELTEQKENNASRKINNNFILSSVHQDSDQHTWFRSRVTSCFHNFEVNNSIWEIKKYE